MFYKSALLLLLLEEKDDLDSYDKNMPVLY